MPALPVIGRLERYIVPVLVIAGWEAFSRSGALPPALLPAPSTVARAWADWIFATDGSTQTYSGTWLLNTAASLWRVLAGFGIAALLGVGLGVAIGWSRLVEVMIEPTLQALRPIPPVSWIPLAIIWFGISETAAAFIISIGIFWINYFTSMTAVQAVDKDLIEVARAFGHRSLVALLRKVILPGAAPGILSGLRAGLGQGWMTVVAAELFGIAGIGQRMIEASGLLASENVIAW